MKLAALLAAALLAPLPVIAQDLEVGRNGWTLERLSGGFVLLRTEIHEIEQKKTRRQGLLLLTCDHQSRRIRFQIGESPRQPSTEPAEFGRAMVQGERNGRILAGASLNPRVRFYLDGSFEFAEAIGFSDPVMRDFLHLLKRLPTRMDIVFYRGPETGAFRKGVATRLALTNLDAALASIYGFEGLCYRGLGEDAVSEP